MPKFLVCSCAVSSVPGLEVRRLVCRKLVASPVWSRVLGLVVAAVFALFFIFVAAVQMVIEDKPELP